MTDWQQTAPSTDASALDRASTLKPLKGYSHRHFSFRFATLAWFVATSSLLGIGCTFKSLPPLDKPKANQVDSTVTPKSNLPDSTLNIPIQLGREEKNSTLAQPAVLSTTSSPVPEATTAKSKDLARSSTQPNIQAVAIAINGSTRNQVRVNNTPIVSLGPEGGERAKIIARRLQNLASRQKLAPAIAEPQQVNGLPVGSVGDRVVFTVDPDTADWYGRRPEDLTVMWVNNLRIALGGQPLPERKALNYQYNFRPPAFDLQGLASWYGPYFYGRPTASGEIYRPGTMTAAHKTLPLGTYLRVTAPSTGRSIVVRINDRGPYVGPRILDLSETAAQQLGVWEVGVAPVQIDILESPTFEE